MKLSRYIFGSLLCAAMLLPGACQDAPVESQDIVKPGDKEDDGMVDVTITLSLKDSESPNSRADDESPSSLFTEKIKNIDLLVYALRDANDNVLYQYGKGVVDASLLSAPALTDGRYNIQADNNQTLMKVTWVKDVVGSDEEVYRMDQTISLRVMRGTVFKLSLWAQSSNSTAYDFNYLSAVKVNYDDAMNNDETRDAFCATSIFSIGQVASDISVTLTRPFAQINVGINTSAITADDSPYNNYKYSQITLEGVSKYFNVIENKAWSDEDIANWQAGTFGQNYNEHIFDAEGGKTGTITPTTQATFGYNNLPVDEKGQPQTFQIHNYAHWTGSEPEVSTYKSLSMCYVLVPEPSYIMDEDGGFVKDDAVAGDNDETEGGIIAPTLSNILIKLRSFQMKEDENSTVSDEIVYPVIKNGTQEPLEIGVKRNWRTNLLFEDWSWTNPVTH